MWDTVLHNLTGNNIFNEKPFRPPFTYYTQISEFDPSFFTRHKRKITIFRTSPLGKATTLMFMNSVKFLWYTFFTLTVLSCTALVFAKSTVPSSIANANNGSQSRDWQGVRVLHIGDSQLQNWGLRGTLKNKFKAAGAAYSASAWKGSSSRSWLWSGKLVRLLHRKAPHVVLVNLGTNVSRADEPGRYAKFVTRLAKKISPRECYWVAPPPLIEDKFGFYDMLQSASKPCIFLDSRKIDFQVPEKRVFHLNRRQSTVWAEQIWKWLNSSPSAPPEGKNGV